jgi:HD-like signal output (HDOD) protein
MALTAIDPVIRERVLRLSRKLPTAPQIFSRLSGLLNDINADLESISKLVSVDSGLTARAIRLSNSAVFRGDEPVATLDEAISRVGFREMHRVVGMAMTDQIFQSGMPVYNLTADAIWENSVVTALAMERLAGAAGEDESVAYTVGLLRPVGKLVLDIMIQTQHPGVTCPESDTLDLPPWERAWADLTSNEAGSMILEDWKLPESAIMGLRFHYQPDAKTGRLGALLHVACWLAKELGKGIQAETRQWNLSESTLQFAGLTMEQVQECQASTTEALTELQSRLKNGK